MSHWPQSSLWWGFPMFYCKQSLLQICGYIFLSKPFCMCRNGMCAVCNLCLAILTPHSGRALFLSVDLNKQTKTLYSFHDLLTQANLQILRLYLLSAPPSDPFLIAVGYFVGYMRKRWGIDTFGATKPTVINCVSSLELYLFKGSCYFGQNANASLWGYAK